MEDRLASLIFMPPCTGRLWSGIKFTTHRSYLRKTADQATDASGRQRKEEAGLSIPLPLYWSNPPWCELTSRAADVVSGAVADIGVTVSALLRDLSSVERSSSFHDVKTGRHRIIPYRPERYGLLPEDFEDATVIDLRLTVPRDECGRIAFSAQQIARWESTPLDAPLAGGSWVPAASFPPDIPSLDKLSIKIDQLRSLAPQAAVFVSLFPHRIDQDMPAVLSQKPDGIILRCNDISIPALSVAQMTRRTKAWMVHHGCGDQPLWVDTAMMSPSDSVKLIHLGATAVSIDSWCDPLMEHLTTSMNLSAIPSAETNQGHAVSDQAIGKVVEFMLKPYVNGFLGLTESIAGFAMEDRFAATDAVWSSSLGVPMLSFGPNKGPS